MGWVGVSSRSSLPVRFRSFFATHLWLGFLLLGLYISTWHRNTATILEVWEHRNVVGYNNVVFGHCLVISGEWIWHHWESWLLFETATAFLIRDVAKHSLDYVRFDLLLKGGVLPFCVPKCTRSSSTGWASCSRIPTVRVWTLRGSNPQPQATILVAWEYLTWGRVTLHLHLQFGHLAEASIQSDLQYVHLS